MTISPRFLQIHGLHTYTAALINRDDTGLAKKMLYGGTMRTRISSQCLKRHWRVAENDPHALQNVAGFVDSVRSRELVTHLVIAPLRSQFDSAIIDAIEPEFQKLVYGDKADKGKKSRQTLLLGEPELKFLAENAARIAGEATDAKSAAALVKDWVKGVNYKAMAANASAPAGVPAAMFGRMVTSDPKANIDAPVHVAHAFTVHGEETEGDYFTAVDDLASDSESGTGADTVQETEVNSGLFYSYEVIDLPGLIANCGGDKELASRLVHNLIYLIAEVSPGAKKGSTAPYSRADLLLVETGDRAPRSLAEAYRKAVPHDREVAVRALDTHLTALDETYATGEERRLLSLSPETVGGMSRSSLKDVAEWAAARVLEAPDV
ncbi:type I-E CRISPR-associated protein Cas7/Cse4/CasC [Thalassospira xiamenensis]|uniref:CRISPR-associated protein, Cse4 family n=1 Tax=Thalassospira xiamenensis TaxID=220697 RepID=A0A285TXY1_9PROT|nr:type I-E CRISPR-associated protein Cas7/Cse4/CasC [Thalassospira xiamenensis]SOC30915.1 CRISPR-associated protein, Cse4 family [Thalassospira xiamenensis]